MERARTALVHDWLTGQRGGEKVLEVLAEIFPDAPIYTLFHVKGSQRPEIERRDIRQSFLRRAPFLRSRYRSYLPLFPLAAEMFDLEAYDLVVSTSHCVAKGVIPRPGALHVSYVHSPVRYAWNQYAQYFGPGRSSAPARWLAPPLVHYLRLWDTASSARVDEFVANSRAVADRIARYYGRTARVIPPPADVEFFTPGDGRAAGDYWLAVSALVPYKRLDVAVAAFNRSGRRLKIVGSGPDLRALRRQARPNVELVGSVSPEELRELYRGARALVMPGEEDFGIAAVECQACGTPVVAYARGGALETVVPGVTGLWVPAPTPAALAAVLDKAESIEFNKASLRSNAMRFSRSEFKAGLLSFLEAAWERRGAPR